MRCGGTTHHIKDIWFAGAIVAPTQQRIPMAPRTGSATAPARRVPPTIGRSRGVAGCRFLEHLVVVRDDRGLAEHRRGRAVLGVAQLDCALDEGAFEPSSADDEVHVDL